MGKAHLASDRRGSIRSSLRALHVGGLRINLSRPLLAALGGVIGCLLRYWLAGVVQRLTDATTFPTGTLVVNVAGSFIVGLVMALSLDRGLVGDHARILLTTGFCGGFTTMSTFSYETLRLAESGDATLALANVALTIVVCFVATWVGTVSGRALF